MKPKFETLAIQSVENKFKNVDSVSTPIYLSSTYKRNPEGKYSDFIYSRMDNPNRNIIENSIAKLENGKFGFAFSSGMSAINAVFQYLKSGDHIILPDDMYYTTNLLLDKIFDRWNLFYTLVDMSNLVEVKNAIKKNTKLIWVETPSNPLLKVSDISEISKIAHQNSALCAVDNTWLTPVFQNPLNLGADIVMHSSSKYFGGHSDVVGGIIIVNDTNLASEIKRIQILMGSVPSPFDCWLISRGIQTLHLRVSKQAENAFELAKSLENNPQIEQVIYPGLESHPQNKIAKKQQNGFGAMLSILIKGDRNRAFKIIEKLNYFTAATSLGGVESLVEHRKSVEAQGTKTPDNLIRISVGIENISDLISDWDQALNTD